MVKKDQGGRGNKSKPQKPEMNRDNDTASQPYMTTSYSDTPSA